MTEEGCQFPCYGLEEPQSYKKRCQQNITLLLRPCMEITSSEVLFLIIEQVKLFFICAGNELFFVALYLMKWDTEPILRWPFNLTLWFPPTTAGWMATLTLPICLFKNFINLVQLWKASKMLVGVDLAERAAAREKKSQHVD